MSSAARVLRPAVVMAIVLAEACGAATVSGTRGDLASREFVGPEVLLAAQEGRARLRRSRRLREKAYLYIEAWPPETEIRIDGTLKGTGTAMVAEGRLRYRLVSLSAPGYARVDGYVELFERQVVKIRVTLHHDSAVTVLTEPPGAEVRLDNAFAGHTPTTLREIEPGPHQVTMSLGSWTWRGEIDLAPNSTVLISRDIPADLMAGAPPLPASAPPPPAEPPAPARAMQAAAPKAATVAAPAPPPSAPARPAATTVSKPDCSAVCERYSSAVSGSESFREVIRDRCHSRCSAGDLAFSVCAWKARTMDDVAACAALPEPGP